jgi:multidrug efflux pump subunit AcrA (membrane-fusion protein)
MNIKNLKAQLLATPKRRRLALYGSIFGAALLASVSIFATGPNASPVTPAERAWPVSVVTAEPQILHPNFSAFGRLEANRVAHLRSDVVAQIKEVTVNEGDWVQAGNVIIKLDDRQAKLVVLEREAELRQHQANLASMKIQLDLEQQSAEHFSSNYRIAQSKLERHQDLMAKRLISKSLLDEVIAQANQASIDYRNHVRELSNLPNQIAAHEAHVAKAEALLEYAKLDLEKTAIRAPFTGPVLAVHAAPGDHSNLSEPLAELADSQSFEVRVQIPDAYVHQFQQLADMSAITARAENGGTLTLSRLTNHVRAGQTGMDAFFAFRNVQFKADDSTTPPLGRVFSLNIEMPAQTGLIAVPVQSIYENNRVYTVNNGRLVGHQIKRVGESESPHYGYQILIRSDDLKPGEQIITTQLPRAITGLLVEVAAGVADQEVTEQAEG